MEDKKQVDELCNILQQPQSYLGIGKTQAGAIAVWLMKHGYTRQPSQGEAVKEEKPDGWKYLDAEILEQWAEANGYKLVKKEQPEYPTGIVGVICPDCKNWVNPDIDHDCKEVK